MERTPAAYEKEIRANSRSRHEQIHIGHARNTITHRAQSRCTIRLTKDYRGIRSVFAPYARTDWMHRGGCGSV